MKVGKDMKIGLVIAVTRELKSFLESNYKVDTLNIDNKEVYKTNINNNEVYAIKSGCGEIDAAMATQYLITKYGVEVILNYGVTGALKKELTVKDVFAVKGAINHDFDVSAFEDVKPHQYDDLDSEEVPLDKSLIELARTIKPNLKEVVCASGERFVNDRDDKENLAKLGCDICDMEVVAIARVCLLNKVKCLSIKSISDTLDGDASDFEENVEVSGKIAFDLLDKIMNKL